MSVVPKEIAELAELAQKNASTLGASVWDGMEKAARLELLWIGHLLTLEPMNTAQPLLRGVGVSIVEAAGCLSLGLVRPALNSLRAQVDLSLAWLYFKDHPVELRYIQSTGEGFKLKKELLEYFTKWHPNFSRRWGILSKRSTRGRADPYRILSAHMHAQSDAVIPALPKVADIVAPTDQQQEAVTLQNDCSEYLNDIFWCLFADDHMSVPAELKAALVTRFKTPAERAEFFKNG